MIQLCIISIVAYLCLHHRSVKAEQLTVSSKGGSNPCHFLYGVLYEMLGMDIFMVVENKEINGITIVKLTGQIRISTQNKFKEVLDNIVKENTGKPLVLNLEGLVYMNSAGLGIIIEAYKKFKESRGRLVLCCLSQEIMNLFEITKTHRFIEIYENEPEAVNKILS